MSDRPRDTQRAKILASCDDFRAVRPKDCEMPFERDFTRNDWYQAQVLIRSYLRQPWVEEYAILHDVKYYPWVRVYKSKLGSDHIDHERYGSFSLSPTRFDNIELLRYLSQMLISDKSPWHGPEFVRAFLCSIENVMGKEARRSMMQILQLRKVHKRVESKEVRERQQARREDQRVKRAVSRLQETLKILDT
jgi:hypothetical protein